MSSAQQDEEALGKVLDRRLLRRLVGYVYPYRWPMAVAVFFALLQSATQIIGPFLNQAVIDRYLFPQPGAIQHFWYRYLPAGAIAGVTAIAALYVMMLAVGFVLDFAQTYVMQWVGQHSMRDLRREMFAHLQRLQISFFDHNPVGRLVTRLANDVEGINEAVSTALVALVDDAFTLTFILAVMLRFDWRLSLITMAVIPAIFVATNIFRKAVRASYRRVRLALARINVFLQEHITGMAVVQAFNREKLAYSEFKSINQEHCNAWTDAVFAYSVYYPVVEFLSTLAIALILWFGGLNVMHHGTTIGVVFAFVMYTQRFYRPIMDLSDKFNTLQSAMAASERIFKLLDSPVTLTSPLTPAPAPNGPGRIEFDHVWFAYAGEDWVLRDVSFVVEANTSLAIVGHTGAGKTTIVSLLLRFYDVQKGRILLDGVDIRDFQLQQLRSRFGIVLQDPYLFSGTIADNVRMDDDTMPRERVVAAERDANLAEFLASVPDGDATVLRERGSGLSTGQKQLVNFARAIAAQPSILILDEATASVDTDTELKIREALGRMLEGRTSIVIAHRLSTIQRADKILVLHKGVLREHGAHQELLRQRGIYWRLYRLQYKDQELDTVMPGAPAGALETA